MLFKGHFSYILWLEISDYGKGKGGIPTAIGNIYCAVGPLQDMRPREVISLIQLYDPPASHGLSSLPRLAFAQTRAQSLSRASTTQQCEPSAKWHWQLVQASTTRAIVIRAVANEVIRTILKT